MNQFLSFLKKMFLSVERTFVSVYNNRIKQNGVRTGEESIFFETNI